MRMTSWGGLTLHPCYWASKIRLESTEHRLGIFIKSVGEDTVCKIEEPLHPEKHEAGPRQHQMLSIEIEWY
jgi:hypothetical protein